MSKMPLERRTFLKMVSLAAAPLLSPVPLSMGPAPSLEATLPDPVAAQFDLADLIHRHYAEKFSAYLNTVMVTNGL